ncbi:conserved hypothetical protein [Bosea sp. 62]|nr:conserved hypothetical protein [Bosea sp. 7B]CAD5276377.1 conserved hypothetical protein [Bosea sp. 21B]CAD5277533.1 conserved hypothetical protein [Bosea sp. 46]VVT59887.1 conserved hypothetical protein [Bosea sp. EC-HK365B]VXB47509.1 conserved hypothetical protein [Bosea sp. 62]VXC08900.1 conserved hypothetical protein [Bosea sp. 127]VXC21855.1 conserved hypothetical protein [Bosea sp. 29B]VXC74910.1 conserved hypothetical protein [Bosea sp. 125]
MIKQTPWRLLPGVMGSDRLTNLAAHLICQKCRTGPDPETVKPRAQPDAPAMPAGSIEGGAKDRAGYRECKCVPAETSGGDVWSARIPSQFRGTNFFKRLRLPG